MNNIVCLKSGTDKYPPHYVNRLFYAVRRNTTVPFKFHCFTNHGSELHPDINAIPLPHELPGVGWWQKLYMFSPDTGLEGRVFYLDLDTLVVGNIDHLVTHNDGFVVLKDFLHERFPQQHYDVGSGVMSWTVGDHAPIWETFFANPAAAVKKWHPHGDQKWVEQEQKERLYWQELYPKHLVSFKMHCQNGIPDDARLVSFHGTPSIPEAITTKTKATGYTCEPAPWIQEYWKDDV